jgi:hypothetical protein
MTPEEEVVADADMTAGVAAEAQAKAEDKDTWFQVNKYYSTKEYMKFTAAKKEWDHQHRTKSPATKCKVAAV